MFSMMKKDLVGLVLITDLPAHKDSTFTYIRESPRGKVREIRQFHVEVGPCIKDKKIMFCVEFI